MLSQGAFNALLKTLEEPPEHVKFILATTEPQKLPATILSRCQRFDFKKVSNENIIKRLRFVCEESNIEITDGALNIIGVLSEGAVRDALSILERCIQDGDNKIDEDKIKDLVGIPKIEFVHGITNAIVEYNVEEALNKINQVLDDGKELSNFVWEIIKYVKDILIYKSSGKVELYSEDEISKIDELSKKVDKQRLINLVYELSNLEVEMKKSTQKIIMFQAGIINLCNKEQKDNSAIEERITKIENYLKSGNISVSRSSNIQTNTIASRMPASNNTRMVQNVPINNSNVNTQKTVKKNYPTGADKYWPQIVNDIKTSGKIVLYTNLLNTRAVELNDMTVGIEFPNGLTSFGKTILEKQENKREISNLVSMACGKEMQIKYITGQSETKTITNEDTIQNFAKDQDIPFEIIEE